jgi:hypothetical protein
MAMIRVLSLRIIVEKMSVLKASTQLPTQGHPFSPSALIRRLIVLIRKQTWISDHFSSLVCRLGPSSHVGPFVAGGRLTENAMVWNIGLANSS